MRHVTARLEYGYCSITVANYRLITVIRFVSKSYTHPWKGFANKLSLVLHAYTHSWKSFANKHSLVLHTLKILFSEIVCRSCDTQPNRPSVGRAGGRNGKLHAPPRAHEWPWASGLCSCGGMMAASSVRLFVWSSGGVGSLFSSPKRGLRVSASALDWSPGGTIQN